MRATITHWSDVKLSIETTPVKFLHPQPLAAHVVPETKLPETKIAAASCEATAIPSPVREA